MTEKLWCICQGRNKSRYESGEKRIEFVYEHQAIRHNRFRQAREETNRKQGTHP